MSFGECAACNVDPGPPAARTLTEFILDTELAESPVTLRKRATTPNRRAGFQRVIPARRHSMCRAPEREEVTGPPLERARCHLCRAREPVAAYLPSGTGHDPVRRGQLDISHWDCQAARHGSRARDQMRGASENETDMLRITSRTAATPSRARSSVPGLSISTRRPGRGRRIDPLIGRDARDCERTIQILCRRSVRTIRSMSVRPGVGKTAIAEGLAKLHRGR